MKCMRFLVDPELDDTVDRCICGIWPASGLSCSYLAPKYFYIAIVWLALTLFAVYCFFLNFKMTIFLLHRHKFRINPANLSSLFITLAMLSEVARHCGYFIRTIGKLDGSHDFHSPTTGMTTLLGSAGLATLSLAWMDIASKSKHLKRGRSNSATANTRRHIKKSKILLYSILVVEVLVFVVLSVFKKVEFMSVVAVVVTGVLLVLMYIGGRRLVAILPEAKPGQLHLGELIQATTRRFFYVTIFTALSGTLLFVARHFILRDGNGDLTFLLMTVALLIMGGATIGGGFIMHNFFWQSQSKARKELMKGKEPTNSNSASVNKSSRLASNISTNIKSTIEFENPVLKLASGKKVLSAAPNVKRKRDFLNQFSHFKSDGALTRPTIGKRTASKLEVQTTSWRETTIGVNIGGEPGEGISKGSLVDDDLAVREKATASFSDVQFRL